MTTTTLVIMRDAAWPSSVEPSTSAELVYGGGDTPNPLPLDQSTARYRVPAWVRSNPFQVDPKTDADLWISTLRRYNVPTGIVTVLDLETAVAPAYVDTFGGLLHAAGYLVWPYGSTDYLFQNPPLDGYFAADPTTPPAEHLYPGTVATQYGGFGTYDLSVIAPGAALWDTQTPPPPAVSPKEMDMFLVVLTDTGPIGAQGTAWLVTDNGLMQVMDDLTGVFGTPTPVSNGQAVHWSAKTPKI